MELNTEGNLLEIMDLARTLRQEQLFIHQEQTAFAQLTETLSQNSASITKLAYICAQQKQNLNDLILSRPDAGPQLCCRRAKNYENAKFVDAKKVLDYEHAIAYEELFNHLYRSPYLLALSLATGDRIADITPAHLNSVIHTISTGLYGNAINTKDVEMTLKLLRELIEIQIVVNENPRRLLRVHSSAFARLYHRLNESMFSAKIFLTAALFEPLMGLLGDSDVVLDVDPNKVVQSLSSKERLKRFGAENSEDYAQNVMRFHVDTITKLHQLALSFIDNLTRNWSLFPSTLRWLVQTMSHHLKQAHFSDKAINEVITDMVFTHFICPAIVSPDIAGIIDAPISDQMRLNLIQIGQIIQMLALAKHDDVEAKFTEIYRKFESNMVTKLIDLLLVSQSGEDVVALLSQQSDFERSHMLGTQSELRYFVEFFRILVAHDEYDVSMEERQKLKKILGHLPESMENNVPLPVNGTDNINGIENRTKERTKQSFMSLGKVTKNKIAKSINFNTNGGGGATVSGGIAVTINGGTSSEVNATASQNGGDAVHEAQPTTAQGGSLSADQLRPSGSANSITSSASTNSSPIRAPLIIESSDNEPVLIFSMYNNDEHKLQPLTEEEVLKMNSIGQDIANGDTLLIADAESCNLENGIDKTSMANGFDGIDDMSDVLGPLHVKTTRFSLSHDDASIGNSDNLEAVSEAPSNHSVTSSLELEENDQNDNLSDMVSANVSGRGTPNISGRDTPSSQVTDGESVHNAMPTPQMQKLISKVRSDIEDKFCKFEIKKFEGDETVSIISDTWSTDVLASDSETLDASERERDRNFSTPLIPSAVVLPGDNNFEALAGAGAVRPNYLDASDQRSESNWSTDVLASDSEKLAEVDTDDNLSITAKSDITDAGVRCERERDQLAAAISAPVDQSQHRHNSSYYAARGGRGFRMVGSLRYGATAQDGVGSEDGVHGNGSSGSNASDHSQEDSAFFDAVNLFEDVSIVPTARSNVEENEQDGNAADQLEQYHGFSSLARSSVRTTNQLSGENSFQQNYKSSSSHDGKESFLATPPMRRQTSAESSISNQSLNMDDAVLVGKPPKAHHQHKGAAKKKKQHGNNVPPRRSHETKDLIDFSDFGCEERTPTASAATDAVHHMNSSSVEVTTVMLDIFGDDAVERRSVSFEQRSAVFDGRRNGIMALKGGSVGGENESGGTVCTAPPVLRRHQSLNYENHEIVLNSVHKKHMSVMPLIKTRAQTDDDKRMEQQQELMLCAKTEALSLNDANGESSRSRTSGIATNAATSASSMSTASAKPTKSTGAIPKSISFDASADKNNMHSAGAGAGSGSMSAMRSMSQRIARPHDAMRHNAAVNSGIFNKLKQGIFKHRRNKSHRHTVSHADELSQSSRSVSFSTNASEVSVELTGAGGDSGTRNLNMAAGSFGGDINEDILAKYRRKVSTSSEATNSDSTGHSGLAVNNQSAEADKKRLPHVVTLHDKTLAFNIVKKKIRTVLSKTDLHTSDFRHTTYSNASPLLTYLQIQLAQAINLQNFQQISYVSEAIRCISSLESNQHAQLLEELQNDIQKRQHYLQYLMRYRQNLLLIMENIGQFELRLRSDRDNCNRYLMAVCVHQFLEKRQSKIDAFQEEFARLTMSDDKIYLIEEFIDTLMEELLGSGGVLHGMPDRQAQEARISIERVLLQRMYHQVMFPNEDADLSRDTVLSEHIRKLQHIIRPSHPALAIPQEYLSEAPWTFAQQQLSYISAYKTPREKLQCVIRCISSIMSLLHMSSGRVPAADDLLPVLIYVVIMANPPYLLSTIEYITYFIGEKIDGEEQFHWTLFGSVVKFIKTMDYLV